MTRARNAPSRPSVAARSAVDTLSPLELGLVDGLGSASYVARELIGEEEIVDYTPKPDFFEKFSGGMGTAMANALMKVTGGISLR